MYLPAYPGYPNNSYEGIIVFLTSVNGTTVQSAYKIIFVFQRTMKTEQFYSPFTGMNDRFYLYRKRKKKIITGKVRFTLQMHNK